MLSYWEAFAYALWASSGITIIVGIQSTSHWMYVTIAVLAAVAGTGIIIGVKLSRLAYMVRSLDTSPAQLLSLKRHPSNQ